MAPRPGFHVGRREHYSEIRSYRPPADHPRWRLAVGACRLACLLHMRRLSPYMTPIKSRSLQCLTCGWWADWRAVCSRRLQRLLAVGLYVLNSTFAAHSYGIMPAWGIPHTPGAFGLHAVSARHRKHFRPDYTMVAAPCTRASLNTILSDDDATGTHGAH